MRQPLWIVNSSLVVIAGIAGIIFFAMKQSIPSMVSLRVNVVPKTPEKSLTPINLASIYQNDLFGTYILQNPTQLPKDEFEIPQIPMMPPEIMPKIPVIEKPTFIEPLNVLLKGVIYINDDPLSSIAIIQDGSSKAEFNYKIGDIVEDAQLLKIFPHSIIVLRANGQQETLYLREEDAAKDINLEINSNSDQVVYAKVQNPGSYQVYVPAFKQKISSLGQFIDALDLTTIYKQGKPVGLRIGRIQQPSLAQQLGLQAEDMIEGINDIAVDTIENRVKAFEVIIGLPMQSTITVKLQRNLQPLTLQYLLTDQVLSEIQAEQQEKVANAVQPTLSDQAKLALEDKRKQLLQQRYTFAPTLQQIEATERMNMLKNKQNNISTYMPQNIKNKQEKSS